MLKVPIHVYSESMGRPEVSKVSRFWEGREKSVCVREREKEREREREREREGGRERERGT